MISTIEARHIMNRTNKDEAVNTINRRTALAAGLASASLISSTSAFAEDAPAGSPEARLRQLGIELPKVAAPVANYVPAARLGNIIFLAGTGPLNPDGSRPQGKVGRDVTLRTGQSTRAERWPCNCSRRCGEPPVVSIRWFASAECSAW